MRGTERTAREGVRRAAGAALLPRFPAGRRRLLWAAAAAGALAWAALEAGLVRGDLVNPGGWTQIREFLTALLRPALGDRFLRLTAEATLTTLAFAVCGTFLAVIFGAVGGVLGSEVWWQSVFRERDDVFWSRSRAPWLVVRGALALPRAIHEIVWGLFFIAIVGLDPLVGVLAIAIPYGAITAKVFSEILDEAPRNSFTALLNRGVSPLKAFLYSLVPEAFTDLLSYAFYRLECSIRSAAVLGIIGAGGLGYQIFLSLQALRYEEMWTFLIALVALTGLTDLWSGVIRRRLGSPNRIEIDWARRVGPAASERGEAPGTGPEERNPEGGEGRPRRDPVVRGSVAAGLVLLVVSFWHIGPHFEQLAEPRTATSLARLAGEAFPPSTGGLGGWEFVDLSGKTLAMSVLAIVGAAGAGVVLSFPAATNFLLPGGILLPEKGRRIWRLLGAAVFAIARGVLLFLRAVPAPIWALLLLFVFFPGILPGAIALALYTAGVLGRLMAEVTENLDARPLRALRAQGASGLQVFLYGVLPATMPRYLSYFLYRWEVTIRATVMVGLVGAGGLGRLLTEQLSSFDYAAVTTTLACYVVLTFLVDMVSAAARREVRGG